VVAVIVALGVGAVRIAPAEVVAILLGQLGLEVGDYSDREEMVLTAIRTPRVIATALVGAAWAGAGVAMQGLFRTPLADPALVGIGGGAALGAALGTALAVSLGLVAQLSGTFLVVGVAFAAAIVAAVIIYRVASASGRVVVATMLLAGLALTALFGAVTALVVAGARTPELGSVAFWTLGSFAGVVGRDDVVDAVLVLPALAVLWRIGPQLDALALGESAASHLGVDVRRLAIVAGVLFSLLTAVAVATAGIIAFVALLVPTVVRAWVGRDHRTVVIGSALLGATYLVVADVLARSLFSPLELSIGVITTLVGAPVFLWLLLHDRGLLAR
jgi:iron complex transport system permease protein